MGTQGTCPLRPPRDPFPVPTHLHSPHRRHRLAPQIGFPWQGTEGTQKTSPSRLPAPSLHPSRDPPRILPRCETASGWWRWPINWGRSWKGREGGGEVVTGFPRDHGAPPGSRGGGGGTVPSSCGATHNFSAVTPRMMKRYRSQRACGIRDGRDRGVSGVPASQKRSVPQQHRPSSHPYVEGDGQGQQLGGEDAEDPLEVVEEATLQPAVGVAPDEAAPLGAVAFPHLPALRG